MKIPPDKVCYWKVTVFAIVTMELIVPELIPEAVNPVVEVALSWMVSVQSPVGGRLSNTKAGMVKCWSRILALQTKVTMSPVI